jgi:hypothetical protein
MRRIIATQQKLWRAYALHHAADKAENWWDIHDDIWHICPHSASADKQSGG